MIYEIGPSRTSMVTYVFPLVGVLLGVIILKETNELAFVSAVYLSSLESISSIQNVFRNCCRKDDMLQPGSTHE